MRGIFRAPKSGPRVNY